MSRSILINGPRSWALSASCLGVLALSAAASHLGCTPAETGSIDMAKSKSIAAEKGIEANRGGGKTKRGSSATQGVQGRSPLPKR